MRSSPWEDYVDMGDLFDGDILEDLGESVGNRTFVRYGTQEIWVTSSFIQTLDGPTTQQLTTEPTTQKPTTETTTTEPTTAQPTTETTTTEATTAQPTTETTTTEPTTAQPTTETATTEPTTAQPTLFPSCRENAQLGNSGILYNPNGRDNAIFIKEAVIYTAPTEDSKERGKSVPFETFYLPQSKGNEWSCVSEDQFCRSDAVARGQWEPLYFCSFIKKIQDSDEGMDFSEIPGAYNVNVAPGAKFSLKESTNGNYRREFAEYLGVVLRMAGIDARHTCQYDLVFQNPYREVLKLLCVENAEKYTMEVDFFDYHEEVQIYNN